MYRSTLSAFYGSPDGRRFLSRQALVLVASAVAIGALFGDGRLDLAIARWFFDDARHVFPLADQWLLKNVLHDAARTTSAIVALGLFALAIASRMASAPKRLRSYRRELLFASVTCLAGAATVATLKHFSSHACPWDLAIFGGNDTYHSLLTATSPAAVVAGCSPAAHPLTGYAWFGVGFALLPVARRLARRWWAVTAALGTLFGIVQVLRGAHFLSHVLWSGWIVWGVDVALATACFCLPAYRSAAIRSGRSPSTCPRASSVPPR